MKIIHFTIGLSIMIGFSGCINGELNYAEPKSLSKPIKTSKIVEKDFDTAWNEIVANTSTNNFVINNIEKDSGLININFSSNQPSQYIDCGNWNGYFKNLAINEKYDYKGENSSSYVFIHNGTPYRTNRTTSLSGRVNILLQKVDVNKSKVSVNIRYVLSATDNNSAFVNNQTNINSWTVPFGTNEVGSNSIGKTRCISNGQLEKRLLDYLK